MLNLQANWNDDGDALFHRECWANLLIATKIKGEELYLSDLEVNLISEAKKTAEFHDPDLYVAHEARRIVKLLQESEYPVLFTGTYKSNYSQQTQFQCVCVLIFL